MALVKKIGKMLIQSMIKAEKAEKARKAAQQAKLKADQLHEKKSERARIRADASKERQIQKASKTVAVQAREENREKHQNEKNLQIDRAKKKNEYRIKISLAVDNDASWTDQHV